MFRQSIVSTEDNSLSLSCFVSSIVVEDALVKNKEWSRNVIIGRFSMSLKALSKISGQQRQP